MSIDSVKPKSDNMSTFSYAQAAKGQAPVALPATAQAPPTSNGARDASRPEPSVPGSTASSTFDSATTNSSQSTNPESTVAAGRDTDLTTNGEETAATPKASSEVLDTPAQRADKADDESTQDSDKRTKDANSSARSNDGSVGDKKNKKGKKAKTGDKEADQDQTQEKEDEQETAQPPPVLAEAPLPAVNIWQQRKEAQAAKVSAAPAPIAAAANVSDGQAAASVDQKQRTANNGATEAGSDNAKSSTFNGSKAQRKPADGSRSGEQGFRKGASRSARTAEKDGKPFEPLPSITNPSSWPTPDTAASGPKAAVPEQKSAKEEGDDSGPSAPRSKGKWTTLDFVPTVSFETPLPIRGGARGGSRSGSTRGGREGTSRGNHSAGPSTATDRVHEQTNGSRGGSAGTQPSKRTSVDSSAPREAKKAPAASDASKSSDQVSAAASKADAPAKQAPTVNSQGQQPHQSSRSATTDVRPEFASKSADSAKDGNVTSARDSAAASNSGSHRPAERTRGGGRGRGGHSSTNGSTHNGQSHYAQSGPGFSYPSGGPSRSSTGSFSNSYQQVPYNAPFPQGTGSHRGRGSNARQQNGGGRHPNTRPPPMQQPVPMSYDPAMYPQAVPPAYNFFEAQFMPLVQQQLEYYFSIDNLCKDWFLRKHMDSQGFVALNVIAGFKRMRDLVPDYSVVRMVGEQSLLVELVTGEDGIDRVRRRENWGSWILSKDQRDPSAQHDGIKPMYHNPRPVHAPFHPHPMHASYAPESPAVFSPTGNSHFQGYMNGAPPQPSPPAVNGVNGQAPATESQLSATVPEFSPVGEKEGPQTNGAGATEGVAN